MRGSLVGSLYVPISFLTFVVLPSDEILVSQKVVPDPIPEEERPHLQNRPDSPAMPEAYSGAGNGLYNTEVNGGNIGGDHMYQMNYRHDTMALKTRYTFV